MRRLGVVAAALLLATPAGALAASCHDESELPAVVALDEHQGVLRAYTGGALYDSANGLFGVLEYVEGEGWRDGGTSRCDRAACGAPPIATQRFEACVARLPKLTVGAREARALGLKGAVQQRVGACVESQGALWFGLAFEDGKGAGGVGRYDLRTRKLVVRRPALLRRASVTRLWHDGARLWLGTEQRRACIGATPAEGLVVYDWAKDQARSFKGTEDGPCGFLVHGLTFRNGGLWVATDLGLSRWNATTGAWTHLLPIRTQEGRLVAEPTGCEELYRRLLPRLSTIEGATASYGSPRDQLVGLLRAFRPAFARRVLEASDGE